MEIKRKKFIAKEILVLFGAIIFCAIGSYFIVLWYAHKQKEWNQILETNAIIRGKIENINSTISNLDHNADTLYSLYQDLKLENLDVAETYNSFRNTLVNNNQNKIQYFNYLKKNNYKKIPANFDEFNKTFFVTAKYPDTSERKKLEEQLLNLQNSIEPVSVGYDFIGNKRKSVLIFVITTFVLVYPLRIIIATLRWSIQTLKDAK
jgi:hypothetical protein